jgi:hypothetical protein
MRCEKLRQPCSGYRDLNDPGAKFRIQTPFSYSTRRQKPHRQFNENSDAIPDHRKGRRSNTSESLHVLSRSLVESYDMHVMPLILNKFSFPSPGGRRIHGSLEFIPTLLGQADNASVLYLACHAVSYAHLSNISRPDGGIVASHLSSYGKSLHALKLALCDRDLQKHDATLLAVWLLGLYEVG